MRLEECDTILSKRRAPLKAFLLLLIFSLGAMTVNGSLLFGISDAQRTGSILLTVNPTSVVIPQGANATSTITVLSTQGLTGTVSLYAYVPSGSLGIAFNPARLHLPAGGQASSTVTVHAASNATLGDYSVVLTGTALVGKRVISSSAQLTTSIRSTADFGVYAYPKSITVTAGFANTASIVLTGTNGFTGSVSLYATVPFGFVGVMGGKNPISLSPGATMNTSLRVSTTTLTIPGTYNITITGISGSVSHSCILSVKVVDPAPESLVLTGSSAISSAGVALSLFNPGNVPVTLVSYQVADVSGDVWTLANWNGPTLLAATTGQANIFIGSSCPTCGYNGIPFAFQQLVSGHSYVITITTRLNNSFTFTYLAP